MEMWTDRLSTAVLRTIIDGLVVFDAEGRLLFVNDEARRLFGYDQKALLGRPVDDLIPGCARLAGLAVAPTVSRLKRRHDILEGRTRDGGVVPLSVALSVFDWEGRALVAAAVRAETAERPSRSTIAPLQDKVEAVAGHIEQITNDFNNALGVILANLSLAQDDLGFDHPANATLAQIRVSAGRAAGFVQAILDEVALIAARESRSVWSARIARTRALPPSAPAGEASGSAPTVTAGLRIARTSRPSSTSAPTSPRHVLLVDDDAHLLAAGARILERQGCRVTALNLPADALSTFTADPGAFDLVIADYMMPGTSGLDLAASIRMQRHDLPILLVSGRLTEEVRAEAASVGVLQVLPKPYPTAVLLDVVRDLLQPKGHSPAG